MFCHLIHLLTQAEKQEEEEDRQEELLRLAADQEEAKVSNAVVNSIHMICNSLTSKLTHYVLPIA
jgi:hypothetical protein